jgi:antitoxin MazE
MKKKLVKHGNSLALLIEKPILKMMEIDEQTDLDISLENKVLVVKRAKKESSRTRKEEIREIAQEIMDQYDSVFKKLSKT